MLSSKQETDRFLGYTKLSIVGKGAFGTAVLYKRDVDNKNVVIKEVNIMDMPLEERKSAMNEVKVLAALNHPHIIRYFSSFEREGSLFIEMEYADGGTLAQFLDQRIQEKKRIKEQDVLFLFRQITGAIGYMHQHKILHRDLKTANIFLTKQFICKVGDFGISKMMTTLVQAQTVVGTPYYLSPEMCEGKDYDEKSDVWALGCILYEMCELRKPFEAQNLPALVTKITTCEFEPISRKYSDALQQLINSILQKNTIQRPSAQTIHSCIIPQLLQELNNKDTDKMVLNNRRILTERSILYEMKGFKNDFCLEPVKLPNCRLVNVAVGANHCLVVTEEIIDRVSSIDVLFLDALVYSWGDNRCGQLGLGELAPWRYYPIRIDSLTGKNIKQVAAGSGFSIFLNNIGLLMSCGDGRQGCLGHGDWNSITQPRIINRMISVNILQVKCGPDHVMTLSVNGDLYAWGCGKSGRLGLGDEEYKCNPTFVKLPQGVRIKRIYCGGDASMALTSTGQLLACGLNTNNKLGLSSTFQHCEKSLVLTPVKNIKVKIKDVSMGNYHTILITEDGNAITLGRNNEGQLGRGHCKPRAQPEEVNALHHKIMVASCGSSYSVVGTLDNVIYFWGTRYNKDCKKSYRSAASFDSSDSSRPLKNTLFKQGSFSSTGSSVTFSSDIVKNCDQEMIKTPKALLGLYASPEHIAAGELVWLVNVFCFDNSNSIFVWVNTTVPAPSNEESDKSSINQEMVSKWMDFETLKRELSSTLPNTPQPN